jgi:large subunit ribosomal protein L24
MAQKIKKDDTVQVITGKDKGKSGRVFRVMPGDGKVLVEKINVVKRHTKPTGENRQGGIIEKEAPIRMSNIMLVCPKCSKPARTSFGFDGNTKVRVCKKCGDPVDKA